MTTYVLTFALNYWVDAQFFHGFIQFSMQHSMLLVEINSNVQKPGRKSYISNADKKEKEVVGKFILEGRL